MMEGHEYEKLLRAALKEPKGRDLNIEYDGFETFVWFVVKVNGRRAYGNGEVRRDPSDVYNPVVGYELAFERAINNCVGQYIEQRNEEREKNDKRRAEWEAQTEEDLLDRIRDVLAAMAQPVYTYFDNAAAFVPWGITPPATEATKPIRVRITKQPESCLSWYYNMVGKEFDVYEWLSPNSWSLSVDGSDSRVIMKSDCEVVTTPPMPQRKRAVVVKGNWLWCDDEHVDAIKAIPGVCYLGNPHQAGERYFQVDPRFDHDAVVAYIEAAGGNNA